MFSRVAAVAAVLVVAAVVIPSAAARYDRSKPIYFIHGYEDDSAADCNQWNDMKQKFRDWGDTGTFVDVGYYKGDVNCGWDIDHHGSHSVHFASGHSNGSHTVDTNIRHLGYHLAWHIWDHFSSSGQSVDVVGHSMGGLIIRYALAQTERGNADFPPYLLVEDVVTMGTPHGGGRWNSFCFWCPLQVDQMAMGSDFLNWLQDYAWEPDGAGGTQWSTFGSDDDNWVAADRAAGTAHDRDPINVYIGSCHKTWYTTEDNIEHTDFLHDTSAAFTALAWAHHCPGGWNLWYLPWPVKRADLALANGDQ
jgi:pimeloyl-ACP methyl ester carboxylesterase